MVRRRVVEMWDVKGQCEYSVYIVSDSQQELGFRRLLVTACHKIV